jgi:hypothetical protein
VTFAATDEFWKRFYDLSPSEKESVRQKWEIFKLDPFDRSLGTHKIERLSAIAKHTIWSVVIEDDLRVTFRMDGSCVTSLDVGTHKIYR